MNDKKLLHFSVYQGSITGTPPHKGYCSASVFGELMISWQCSRKPTLQYGGHGWCKQHYPPNVQKRKEERNVAWRAKREADDARYAKEGRERDMKNAALEAIRKIAAGHNDPRGLAMEVMGEKSS